MHTFDKMDEQIRFVKVVGQAEMKSTEWHGAATATG